MNNQDKLREAVARFHKAANDKAMAQEALTKAEREAGQAKASLARTIHNVHGVNKRVLYDGYLYGVNKANNEDGYVLDMQPADIEVL